MSLRLTGSLAAKMTSSRYPSLNSVGSCWFAPSSVFGSCSVAASVVLVA